MTGAQIKRLSKEWSGPIGLLWLLILLAGTFAVAPNKVRAWAIGDYVDTRATAIADSVTTEKVQSLEWVKFYVRYTADKSLLEQVDRAYVAHRQAQAP